MWKALGSNLNEENAGRIAHSLEGLKRILHSVDIDCGFECKKGLQILKITSRNSATNCK